jgi:hypothetical protein
VDTFARASTIRDLKCQTSRCVSLVWWLFLYRVRWDSLDSGLEFVGARGPPLATHNHAIPASGNTRGDPKVWAATDRGNPTGWPQNIQPVCQTDCPGKVVATAVGFSCYQVCSWSVTWRLWVFVCVWGAGQSTILPREIAAPLRALQSLKKFHFFFEVLSSGNFPLARFQFNYII